MGYPDPVPTLGDQKRRKLQEEDDEEEDDEEEGEEPDFDAAAFHEYWNKLMNAQRTLAMRPENRGKVFFHDTRRDPIWRDPKKALKRGFYAADKSHPSPKAGRAMGRRIAKIIRKNKIKTPKPGDKSLATQSANGKLWQTQTSEANRETMTGEEYQDERTYFMATGSVHS